MMEYMGAAGNLYQRWKKEKNFSEKETQKIIADICRAVSYLHR
jgi:serine/threonine protein kinase